jgi:hypothetical protein
MNSQQGSRMLRMAVYPQHIMTFLLIFDFAPTGPTRREKHQTIRINFAQVAAIPDDITEDSASGGDSLRVLIND